MISLISKPPILDGLLAIVKKMAQQRGGKTKKVYSFKEKGGDKEGGWIGTDEKYNLVVCS